MDALEMDGFLFVLDGCVSGMGYVFTMLSFCESWSRMEHA